MSTAADRSGHSLAGAVERDFVAAWWLVAEAGGAELHDEPGLRWFATGLDDPHLNAVIDTRLDETESDPRIEGVVTDLRSRRIPFLWWVRPSARPTDLDQRLTRLGLVPEPPWPAMLLEIGRLLAPPTVPDLEIRRVSDARAYRDYEAVYAPILSTSADFTELFAAASQRIGFASDAPEVHYVGYLDDEPVATVSLISAGGAAGIYNVATVAAARGRGIGAAMTAWAVRAGADRGMQVATLQASTMGRPVYERLGFEFVCDFVPYRPA